MNLRACDPRAFESLMTPPIARCQGKCSLPHIWDKGVYQPLFWVDKCGACCASRCGMANVIQMELSLCNL